MRSVSESYHVSYWSMASSRLISYITRTIVAFVILAIAIVAFLGLVMSAPTPEITTGERSYPAVVVMEADQIQMARRTVGYGTATAMQHADVPARVSSTVSVVPPTTRVGYSVSKGDLLIELDDIDFVQQAIRAELALSSARSAQIILKVERAAADERAQLSREEKKLAEVELARVTDAFNRGAAKQREVDQAKQKSIAASSSAVNAAEIADRFPSMEEQASSTVSSKQAELAIAQENVKRCKIVSPIDGVIQEVDVRVGEHVNNGTRIARIVNSGHLEIPLRLPSHARSTVHVHDPVSLRSAGFGKRYWDATVSRIAPEDDSQTRTMIVYVDVEQDPQGASRIPPGLFVRGEVLNTKDATPRWVVPRRSIRDDRIFVVRDSVVRSIPVIVEYSVTGVIGEFNLPDFDWAVLSTPLEFGDLIVVDPGGSLRDGMSVRSILASGVALE